MSKQNDKYGSTFYNYDRKKVPKTPPKIQTNPRKLHKPDNKHRPNQNQAFQDIVLHEKDQRFKYLLKHGDLKKIQKNGNIIFAQLPQIQNVWVCYRRPCQRQNNIDRLCLDSLELNHIPLLQGQQKLKMLTFQHNHIQKIQNLISLHNLLYLDLFDNQIKEIQNLSTGVPTIKVLLLPKNQLTKIKNINQLVKLEVLDLHANKISKIQGFGLLNSLRILNLAHNQITKIQHLENLSNLTELNLKSNLIVTLQNIKHLTKLQKLYLASNRLQIKSYENCQLTKLSNIKDLSLQNNPCSKDKIPYLRNIIKYLSHVKILDGKTPTLMEQKDSNSQEQNHVQVLNLIAEQWEQQKKRIKTIEASNGSKRQYLKTTLITGGHAEIEDESILFIYGNSYQVVLSNQNFQETVQKIRFQYVFIEFLIEQNVLNTLKKFRKLKILEFSQNYIMSLLQIAKLQNLLNLKTLAVQPKGNPISACTFLKQFIIYRFPSIIQINREDVKDSDRNRAKILFQNFDKALQIPEKTFGPESLKNYPCQEANAKKDRNYIKNFNKIINQQCEEFVWQVSEKAEKTMSLKNQAQSIFDLALTQMIRKAQIKAE